MKIEEGTALNVALNNESTPLENVLIREAAPINLYHSISRYGPVFHTY